MSASTKNGEVITVEYDLYGLPTAQHKAGLAGLILMVESMRMRKMEPLPELRYDSTKASISLTRETIQTLFDDLYDATWEEVESRSKWKGRTPKREAEHEVEAQDGKKRKTKYYVYDQYVPEGAFLETFLPDDSALWLKLWRNMLWKTLRGRPLARKVYEERANKQPSSVAVNTWERLTKSAEYRSKGKILTDGVVSSTFIGAQDRNAENVPFQGTVEQNLLLHFWTIPSLVYVPRLIKKDDKSKEKDYRLEEAGYVLAIPEPSNLETFIEDARRLLKSLETEKSGYRPRAALIAIPGEGGLEYLYHLARSRVTRMEIAYSLVAVEIYHLEKRGNDIRTLAAERILSDERVLATYDKLRKQCRSPLFKAERIRNLLSGEPWWAGMAALFSQYPWQFFIFTDETPRRIPFFGYDAVNKFNAIQDETNGQGGEPMSAEAQDDKLALCVKRLIYQYARLRTEEKSGERYEKFKDQRDDKGRLIYPAKYREKIGDVCSDAFLAMRGRSEKDFVEYFTGTICSVPQYLPEEDYLVVSRSLMTQPDKVKTLSMLALSACSSVARATEE